MEELERKFLVIEPSDKLNKIKKDYYGERVLDVKTIHQHYLMLGKNKSLRIRKTFTDYNSKCELTVKEGTVGINEEITFEITHLKYDYLEELSLGSVHKKRIDYELEYGLVAEIDIFEDFTVIEIEFANGGHYMEMDGDILKKFGLVEKYKEVTGDYKYKNSYIATGRRE